MAVRNKLRQHLSHDQIRQGLQGTDLLVGNSVPWNGVYRAQDSQGVAARRDKRRSYVETYFWPTKDKGVASETHVLRGIENTCWPSGLRDGMAAEGEVPTYLLAVKAKRPRDDHSVAVDDRRDASPGLEKLSCLFGKFAES